ncbi:Gfo/Idh/MocA family protein [Sporohalobacter salinus]|uniref:Gfo/Idh/MocA family protein n=1 Tax=Sporohalobacter salinus TaxID=1494606 RepID=UPI00196144ED|nr:Gfo/Idh/MocA family oxidoreductase [Sporohalobacter salinus]MBM7623042.1 putative dehydrogenase [Sporohalobacter salinus]
MSKLKFALVGSGRIADKHTQVISKLENAELVSICDINESKAKEYGDKFNIPYYTSYDDMLQQEEIDVVNILTPSGLHAKHTIDIVEKYQKHIVCEKPMALKLEDADEMIRVCDKHGVRLFVVKQNRYNLPVQKLRKAIEEGRFGKLVMGTVRVRWTRHQHYYDMDDWRGTWAMDGGVLTNQASHHIDLLEWMMGQPVEVSAQTATRLVDIETEDTGAVVIRFANGALGIVEATTATRPQDLEGSLSILGEKGAVEVGGFAVNEMKTWQFEDEREEDKKVMKEFKENPPNVYGFGHKRYLKHVVDCVENDKKALVDGLEGRKSLELINAIYEASETGRTVRLKFEPQKCKLGVLDE